MSGTNPTVTKSNKQVTKIIVAALAALATIMAAYFQFAPKPPGNQRQFTGRVSDVRTEKPIRKAKVTLEVQGAPPVIYTDSEGIFSFPLKSGLNELRLRVEAAGYQNYDRRVNLAAKAEGEIEDIRIEPIVAVVSAPTPRFSPRPTTPPASPQTPPQRLRVIGDHRRDVYLTPNGSIVGKVEPGTILRVVEVITVNGGRWYHVNLENGDMYTLTRPNETLMSGWVSDLAVEKK